MLATIYLEKTDLQNEAVVDQSVPTDEQPKPIYKVACKSADKTVFFSPEEIDFIESINGVSNIRIGDEYFPATATMSELTDKLSKFGFFRCHRSYLVNLQRVAELISYSKNSYTLILKGPTQTKLPLSRSRVVELQQLLTI